MKPSLARELCHQARLSWPAPWSSDRIVGRCVSVGCGRKTALPDTGACENEAVLLAVLGAALASLPARWFGDTPPGKDWAFRDVLYACSRLRDRSGYPRYCRSASLVFGLVAIGSAFVAAMLTHVPSAYRMVRFEFGGPLARSLLLSLAASVTYSTEASRRFRFYGLMLLLFLAAAGWRAVL